MLLQRVHSFKIFLELQPVSDEEIAGIFILTTGIQTVPRWTFSRTDNSLNGHFPDGQFPE